MATKTEAEIQVVEIKTERITYCLLGRTPILLNSMNNKIRGELLLPRGRKTSAEKASSLKHNPFEEFRRSPYTLAEGPTLLAHLSTAFKKAIASTAVDIPGARKAQIGRLLWVEGEKTPIYGIPKLHMAVTRSADMNRTPDVRTRCVVQEWAAYITVAYPVPILKHPTVTNLLAAAGMIQGIGDWRPEKGSGTYGQFEIVEQNDEEFNAVVNTGARDAQIRAMELAEPYNEDTAELLSWFVDEAGRRGFDGVAG